MSRRQIRLYGFPRPTLSARGGAFTLVELLVVIGILAMLIAILLPTLATARAQANTVVCASNERQLCQGLFIYASQNNGDLPPYLVGGNPPRDWTDKLWVGHILTPSQPYLSGAVAICPEDTDAVRSYAMNVYACTQVEGLYNLLANGSLFRASNRKACKLILVAERWSYTGNARTGWTAPAIMGNYGTTPASRFGADGGVMLPYQGRWGWGINCELPYMRHRARKGPGHGTQPTGRVNIAYLDGHVAIKSNGDLVDRDSGLSTLDSLWSPMDPELNVP